MDELLKYGASQGPWAFIAIACLIGIWRGSKWIGKEVLYPISKRHIEFVNSVANTLQGVADTLESVRDELRGVRSSKDPAAIDTDKVGGI